MDTSSGILIPAPDPPYLFPDLVSEGTADYLGHMASGGSEVLLVSCRLDDGSVIHLPAYEETFPSVTRRGTFLRPRVNLGT